MSAFVSFLASCRVVCNASARLARRQPFVYLVLLARFLLRLFHREVLRLLLPLQILIKYSALKHSRPLATAHLSPKTTPSHAAYSCVSSRRPICSSIPPDFSPAPPYRPPLPRGPAFLRRSTLRSDTVSSTTIPCSS